MILSTKQISAIDPGPSNVIPGTDIGIVGNVLDQQRYISGRLLCGILFKRKI